MLKLLLITKCNQNRDNEKGLAKTKLLLITKCNQNRDNEKGLAKKKKKSFTEPKNDCCERYHERLRIWQGGDNHPSLEMLLS